MNQLPYHTTVYSSMDSNHHTETTFSSLVPEKFSPRFISTEENDPMLGYTWNNKHAPTPPSPPHYSISFDYQFHPSLSTHSNTSSINMPSTPTSPETMLWKSSCIQQQQQKEEEMTTSHTTNLPLSPESLYESPLLPPSSGIISTSDILDDTTGLGLPCSLFILNKESSFASGLECSLNNNNNNDTMYSTTTPTTSTLSSSNHSTLTSTPMLFNDQEENNTLIEDMDYYFSEEDEEDEEEQYNNNNIEEEEDDDDHDDHDDEDDDDEEEEDTWPTTLTPGISVTSCMGDSEYGDMEQDHHPLTGLLVDLRKQVDTKQLLKKEEWIQLYKHINDVLNQVSHEEEEAFEIRQCIINCVQQLQSRYQNIFVYLPNEISLEQMDEYQEEEEEEIINIVRDEDEQEQLLVQVNMKTKQKYDIKKVQKDNNELSTRRHLYYNSQQQDMESSSEDEEEEESDKEDEPWIPEEIIEKNTTLSTLVTSSSSTKSIMNTTAIKKRRRGSHKNRQRSSSLSSYSRKTRKNYSRETTRILMDWYLRHGGKTPEPKHKEELAKKANKSHVQISTWFQNARRRHHSKLILYQKLNKEYPDKVYDFDTYEQFRLNKKSFTHTNSKKKSVSMDNDEEEQSDDDDDDE